MNISFFYTVCVVALLGKKATFLVIFLVCLMRALLSFVLTLFHTGEINKYLSRDKLATP